jgi:hypothetical protein
MRHVFGAERKQRTFWSSSESPVSFDFCYESEKLAVLKTSSLR